MFYGKFQKRGVSECETLFYLPLLSHLVDFLSSENYSGRSFFVSEGQQGWLGEREELTGEGRCERLGKLRVQLCE